MNGLETLQKELEKHRESLRDVDESIKKLSGRDLAIKKLNETESNDEPVKASFQTPTKRLFVSAENSRRVVRHDDDSRPKSAIKRKNEDDNKYSQRRHRRSRSADVDSPENDEDEVPARKRTIQSSVISKQQGVIKSKEDLIKLQNKDTDSQQRNRRIFGMILGTLKDFKSDDKKRSETAQAKQRKEIEKKIEVKEIEEKTKIKEERNELLKEKKKQERQIKIIERNIQMIDELQQWEKQQNHYKNFIKTKTKPFIFYLPKIMDETSEKLLATCVKEIEELITQKKLDTEKDIELFKIREYNEQQHNENEKENVNGNKFKNVKVDEASDNSELDDEDEEAQNNVNIGDVEDEDEEPLNEESKKDDKNESGTADVEIDTSKTNIDEMNKSSSSSSSTKDEEENKKGEEQKIDE